MHFIEKLKYIWQIKGKCIQKVWKIKPSMAGENN